MKEGGAGTGMPERTPALQAVIGEGMAQRDAREGLYKKLLSEVWVRGPGREGGDHKTRAEFEGEARARERTLAARDAKKCRAPAWHGDCAVSDCDCWEHGEHCSVVTVTFGDQGENDSAMEQIGEMVEHGQGFAVADLEHSARTLTDRGIAVELKRLIPPQGFRAVDPYAGGARGGS